MELKEQERRFEEDTKEKRKEIIELKNQQLHHDLRHKSQELASSTMNLIRKNEILLEISQNLNKVSNEITDKSEPNLILKEINKMQNENDENDKPKYYQGIVRDISNRKQAEAEIKENLRKILHLCLTCHFGVLR